MIAAVALALSLANTVAISVFVYRFREPLAILWKARKGKKA